MCKLFVLVRPSTEQAPEEEKKGLYPPLGILYLATVLKLRGFDVRCYDLNLQNEKELLNFIASEEVYAIGFSVLTQSFYSTTRLIQAIKSINSDVPIIVGGPHPTLVPEDFLGIADIVVVGEGESAIDEVLHLLKFRRSKETKIVKSKFVENLDSIPIPDRDIVDIRLYGENMGAIITSRGCPYNCLFCTTRYIMGRRFRAASANHVLEEWRLLKSRYGAPKIRIVDDVFTLDRRRAVAILEKVKEDDLGPWSLPNGIRADNIDEKLLDLMAESGCTTVWYGAESGDPRVLKVLRKGVSLDQIEKVVKATKDRGIKVGLFFMLGAPGETLESIRMTIDFIYRLEPDYVHFSIATPYPNTEFWQWVEKNGRFLTKDYRYFERVFIFETPDYPLEDRVKAAEIVVNELRASYGVDIDIELLRNFLKMCRRNG